METERKLPHPSPKATISVYSSPRKYQDGGDGDITVMTHPGPLGSRGALWSGWHSSQLAKSQRAQGFCVNPPRTAMTKDGRDRT